MNRKRSKHMIQLTHATQQALQRIATAPKTSEQPLLKPTPTP